MGEINLKKSILTSESRNSPSIERLEDKIEDRSSSFGARTAFTAPPRRKGSSSDPCKDPRSQIADAQPCICRELLYELEQFMPHDAAQTQTDSSLKAREEEH